MSGRRALLIGVPEYISDAISDLSFIPGDIAALQMALESSDYAVTTVGIDGSPAVSGGILRSTVRNFCAKADAGELLLLCFSGHGLHYKGIDYLVPYDAAVDDPAIEDYLVPVNFGDHFESSKASTILFFIDTCREGIDLGTMGPPAFRRWNKGKMQVAKDREVALVFACGPGEVSRFVAGPEGFSLFSRSLAEALTADSPPSSFGEVLQAVQTRLNELADEHGKPRQVLRTFCESAAEGPSIESRQICSCPSAVPEVTGQEDPWVSAACNSTLWPTEAPGGNRTIQALQEHVQNIVRTCREEWFESVSSLPWDPWRDAHLPERILDRSTFLVSLCEFTRDLSVAEAAVLICAPFIREAVLACAVRKAAKSEALSLRATGEREGMRGWLERTHATFPQLVRKAERLDAIGESRSAQAIATWLMHRCLLRLADTWSPEPEGIMSERLREALTLPATAEEPVVRETLTVGRLLEMARCIHSDAERIERTDRPGGLKPRICVTPTSLTEQILREGLIAYILCIGGHMAIDPRTLSEVIVEHIGLSDTLELDDICQVTSRATWVPDGRGRSLQAICQHPAMDLTLRQHVEIAETALATIQGATSRDSENLAPLGGLPDRLTCHYVSPAKLDDGQPAYETPHVRFELAHNEIRELLMGEQLYDNPTLAIRELYQNALDACRYREARTTYLIRVGKYEGRPWEGRIEFKQGEDGGRPFIECQDNGIGMGRRELAEVFAHAGRRFADTPEFIEEQAEWLRCDPPVRLHPNSQFGIGVFSYFMLADELCVRTCRLLRNGTPGEQLVVHISGGGALFRTRSLGTGSESGTSVRLYLSRTHYKQYRTKKPVSCTDVLSELLWIAQYSTRASHGATQLDWSPGVLRAPNEVWRHVFPSGSPALWWTKEEWELYEKPEKVVGKGRLLADGIYTEQETECAIVDLSQAHRPRLTIDRWKPVEWDDHHVRALFAACADSLIQATDWLSIEWLWELEKIAPEAALIVFKGLVEADASLPLRGADQQSRRFRLAELGCSRADAYFIRLIMDGVDPDGSKREWDPHKYSRKQEWIEQELAHLRHERDMAEFTYGGSHAEDTQERIRELEDQQKVAEADSLKWKARLLERQRKALKDLGSSMPSRMLQIRMARLNANGIDIPAWILEGIHASEEVQIDLPIPEPGDALMLSSKLNGSSPWLEGMVSPAHLWLASHALRKSVEETRSRLGRYEGLGLQFPIVDIGALSSLPYHTWTPDLLSKNLDSSGPQFEDLDSRRPWLEDKVSPGHIIRAAAKLEQPIGVILERLQPFAPLGLSIPDVDPASFMDVSVDDGILTIISRSFYRYGPWLEDKVSPGHIIRAAAELEQPIGVILERLQPFAPLGLDVPQGNPADFGEFVVNQEDLSMLGLTGGNRDQDDEVRFSAVDIFRVAEKENQPVREILARLRRFEALGLTLPSDDFFRL